MALRESPHDSATVGAGVSSSQLAALLKVSTALTSSLEMDVVLQAAIDGAVDVLGVDTGAIYLLDGGLLMLGATQPELPPDFPEEYRVAQRKDHPWLEECLRNGAPNYVEDTATADLSPAERGICEARSLKSLLAVPLSVDGASVGTFIVGTNENVRHFSSIDIDLCRTLSYQVSLSVANARLFESVRVANVELTRAYDATLKGWSTALEMRDADTRGHAERVARLAERLAEKLGTPREQLHHVYRGALLHDIGKMTVPDSILKKPGPLDEREWEIMRQHPEHGRRMLESIEFLKPAIDIPYCHHERWDGSGYPQGLKGDDIPLAARVFAVIDVFEALTADRPYRPAWSREEARDYILEQAGRQFDPRVAEAFLNAVDDEPTLARD